VKLDKLVPSEIAAAAPGCIDEITTRLAQIKADYDKLDEASIRLSNLSRSAGQHVGGIELVYLEREMTKIEREEAALEQMLSLSEPRTLRDVLVMLSVAGGQLSELETGEESYGESIRLLGCTLDRIIPLLETIAGVTLTELGLESYFGRDRSVEELLAAAAKVEAAYKAEAAA
jgi:hypothetical protein